MKLNKIDNRQKKRGERRKEKGLITVNLHVQYDVVVLWDRSVSRMALWFSKRAKRVLKSRQKTNDDWWNHPEGNVRVLGSTSIQHRSRVATSFLSFPSAFRVSSSLGKAWFLFWINFNAWNTCFRLALKLLLSHNKNSNKLRCSRSTYFAIYSNG